MKASRPNNSAAATCAGSILAGAAGLALILSSARGLSQSDAPSPDRFQAEITAAYIAGLQQGLHNRGLYAGPMTGRLDPATEHAILDYQETHGLRPDTRDAAALQTTLDLLTFGDVQRAPLPLEARPAITAPVLPVTAPEPDARQVLFVQKRLREKGYAVPASGQFDVTTRNAVRAYQMEAGLPRTGEIDSSLLTKIAQ